MTASNIASEPETRQRLLDAAGRLFAERGFNDVSIREICKEAGGANVAAVNYYFRDKAGLYRELLEYMVEVTWKRDREKLAAALSGKASEEKLHIYIRNFIGNLMGENEDEKGAILGKLMNREMVDPTPEFEVVVDKGMRPNFHLLSQIVGEIGGLPGENLTVIGCTMSTMGQCLIYGSMRRLSKYFAPGMEFTSEVFDGIAKQVTQFSLAGIRAAAQGPPEIKK